MGESGPFAASAGGGSSPGGVPEDAAAGLTGPAGVAAATSAAAPDAAAAPGSAGPLVETRRVELELPSAAPPALMHMLDTPGGPRALAAAARSLLLNNPILQHPGAPCHALLTQLAGMRGEPSRSGGGEDGSGGGGIGGDGGGGGGGGGGAPTWAWAPTAPLPRQPGVDAGATQTLAGRLLGQPMRRDRSAEAVEVLSSQFFSGHRPAASRE